MMPKHVEVWSEWSGTWTPAELVRDAGHGRALVCMAYGYRYVSWRFIRRHVFGYVERVTPLWDGTSAGRSEFLDAISRGAAVSP